jgi:hypothetical protein
MIPVLKAPGSMLLKLRYDEPLSNFAFKFNMRRYTVEGSLERNVAGVNHATGRQSSIYKLNASGGCWTWIILFIVGRGLPLVHFSVRLGPCLTLEPYNLPTYPTKSAHVKPESEPA